MKTEKSDLEEEEFLLWQKFKNYPTPRLLKSLQSSNRVRRYTAARPLPHFNQQSLMDQ